MEAVNHPEWAIVDGKRVPYGLQWLAHRPKESNPQLDRIAQLEGYLEEIRYVYNHWHETARDEIGQVLVHYEFGDSPEVFEAFDPDVLDAD